MDSKNSGYHSNISIITKIVKAYVWETHFLSFYIDILLLGTNFKFYFAIYNLFWALFSMPFHFYVRFLVLWKIYIINKRFFLSFSLSLRTTLSHCKSVARTLSWTETYISAYALETVFIARKHYFFVDTSENKRSDNHLDLKKRSTREEPTRIKSDENLLSILTSEKKIYFIGQLFQLPYNRCNIVFRLIEFLRNKISNQYQVHI